MSSNPFQRSSPEFSVLYIFGAGGSGREIAWLARECWGEKVVVTHLVNHPKYLVESANGNAVQLLSETKASPNSRFVVAVGDPTSRKAIAAACESAGLVSTAIVHPRVESSEFNIVASGAVICAGAVVTTNVRVGVHVHINVGCTISHDVTIGDFSTLSPGVRIAGHVQIGQEVFIGVGATIINGSQQNPLIVADRAVIAAGACVTGSVAASALVAGVPAVRKR
jgi:sugar O-acyltransferase (sialic acid O-acetyltransferase NeuD family)